MSLDHGDHRYQRIIAGGSPPKLIKVLEKMALISLEKVPSVQSRKLFGYYSSKPGSPMLVSDWSRDLVHGKVLG